MKKLSATNLYALAFGLFLGLCIWKFGNPVILDHKIEPPHTPAEWWNFAWPLHWANWILLPLAVAGGLLVFKDYSSGGAAKSKTENQKSKNQWLWLLPLAWLGWQFLATTKSVEADLSTAALWQFSGCVACYLLGTRLFSQRTMQHLVFIGIFAAFAFCLVRAVNQRIFEFPLEHQMLVEGERCGWTNYPPEIIVEMKRDAVIVNTNGVDVANPLILEKFKKGRVAGTLVYPNALAGLILLLWPAALALVFVTTKDLRPLVRFAAIALAIFLGGAAFFWTGSKLGWLLGMGVAGIFLLRLDWPKQWKITAVAAVLVVGLGVFTVRFHQYFKAGATSVGARFDYWRAAAKTTMDSPLFGTGPGTFQRPYARLKAPESEMARLTHNDYLEQFSDSGVGGGLAYAAWILAALAYAGKKLWRGRDIISFAVFTGVLAWFAQGIGEFGLYIPALAWTAFTLLGICVTDSKTDPTPARNPRHAK